jgi:hypothetical protein
MQAICLDCKKYQKIVEIQQYANGLYALRCESCAAPKVTATNNN